MITIRNSRLADAQSLLNQVNAVTTTEQYEADFKTVLRILLETYLADGNLDATDRQVLEGISQQCRYEGGMAVLQARASLDDGMGYDAYDNCPDYFGGGNTALAKKPVTAAGLHPNPANQSTILYFAESTSTGKAILRNMEGQQLDEWTFEETSKVQLYWGDNIPAGLYLLEVIADRQVPQTLKLLIQRP